MSPVVRRVLGGSLGVVSVVFFALFTQAHAHQSEEATHISEVRAESGEVETLLQISVGDLLHHLGHLSHGQRVNDEALEAGEDEVAQYLDERVEVAADGESCELSESRYVAYPAVDGRVHYYQLWQCAPKPRQVEIANRVLFDGHDGYRHVGRVQVGEKVQQSVFDRSFPTMTVYPSTDEEEQEREVAADVQDESPRDGGQPGTHVGDDGEEVQENGARADEERSRGAWGAWSPWVVFTVLLVALSAIAALRTFFSASADARR